MRKNAWTWAGLLCLSVVQMSGAISIRPGFQVVGVKRGGTIDVTFAVDNDQDVPQVIACQVRDSYVLPENKAFTAASWLEPRFKQLTVPAHGSQSAVLRVHAPQGASGELAGFVSFGPPDDEKSVAANSNTAVGTHVITRITVSVYARIEGTGKGEADLKDVRVITYPVNPSSPARIEATVTVKNGGNVHQRPRGSFLIYRKTDTANPLFRMDFQMGMPVFPGDEWPYQSQTTGALTAGDYQIDTRVQFTPTFAIEKKTMFTVDLAGRTTNYHDIR